MFALIKLVFSRYKLYIYAVICLAALYLGWHARGVVAEADKVQALERAIAQAEELRERDSKLLSESIRTITKIETRFVEVEREAANVTDICHDGGAEFFRLYDDAVRRANAR